MGGCDNFPRLKIVWVLGWTRSNCGWNVIVCSTERPFPQVFIFSFLRAILPAFWWIVLSCNWWKVIYELGKETCCDRGHFPATPRALFYVVCQAISVTSKTYERRNVCWILSVLQSLYAAGKSVLLSSLLVRGMKCGSHTLKSFHVFKECWIWSLLIAIILIYLQFTSTCAVL